MPRTSYEELSGFEDVYLEDSYLLGIDEEAQSLVLTVELVLRETHELYQPPKVDEQYCYRRARIVFDDVRELRWVKKRLQPVPGPDEPPDFGNIDWLFIEDNHYEIGGEWGAIELDSASPRIEYL